MSKPYSQRALQHNRWLEPMGWEILKHQGEEQIPKMMGYQWWCCHTDPQLEALFVFYSYMDVVILCHICVSLSSVVMFIKSMLSPRSCVGVAVWIQVEVDHVLLARNLRCVLAQRCLGSQQQKPRKVSSKLTFCPWKLGHPKRITSLPTIHFQELCHGSFREGTSNMMFQ